MGKSKGRPPKGTVEASSFLIESFVEEQDRALKGTIKHHRARKEWSAELRDHHEDMEIEELLEDEEFLGTMNIWPSVKESLTMLWHRRCDFEVSFLRMDVASEKQIPFKTQEVYALSHPHARRKAQRMWPTLASESTDILVRRKNPVHSVVMEMPRGAGKDFEMSLIVVLLVRDLLVQRPEEFYAFYELSPDTRISVNLMNRTEPLAKRVTFAEVIPKFAIPFFLDYFPPSNIDIERTLEEKDQPGELRFPQNIVIFPGTGATSSNLGYALAALVLDECNNMPKNMAQSQSISGDGDTTGSAAEDVYLDGIRRIESRLGQFVMGKPDLWGMVVCLSQSRTSMDFTKLLEQRALVDPGILYRSFPFWERKPLDLCGETFEFDTRSLTILDAETAKHKYEELGAVSTEVFANE